MRQIVATAGLVLSALLVQPLCGPAQAAALPTTIGQCSETVITSIGHRLENPDSGSVVQYKNGLIQITYDLIAAIHRSHVGDKVKVCLVSIPQNCPPGDDRGKVYRATDLRTARAGKRPTRSIVAAALSAGEAPA